MSLLRTNKVRRIAVAAVSISALATSIAIATPALAAPSGDLFAATNASRVAAGLPALQESSQLDAVAQGWANKLAASQNLAHNPNIQTQITNWSTIGENVGMGATIPTLQTAFMNSPLHKANILSKAFTQAGVGTASSMDAQCNCEILWVVVDFKRPETAAAPVKAAPAKTAPVVAPTHTATAKPVTQPAAAATTHASTATPVAPVTPATPVKAATPVTPVSVPLVAASNTVLQAQIANAGPTSHSAVVVDPVASVLDFASVLATLT
jgi:hypothetical protein